MNSFQINRPDPPPKLILGARYFIPYYGEIEVTLIDESGMDFCRFEIVGKKEHDYDNRFMFNGPFHYILRRIDVPKSAKHLLTSIFK
jgi:hypothetical protein